MKILNIAFILCVLGLFSSLLVGCSSGGSDIAGTTEQSASKQVAEQSVSESAIVFKAQVVLMRECKDKGLSQVTDFYSPKCDRIDPVGGHVARIVETKYDDTGKFWRVVFHLDDSTDDGTLVYFFDKNGTYIGDGWID